MQNYVDQFPGVFVSVNEISPWLCRTFLFRYLHKSGVKQLIQAKNIPRLELKSMVFITPETLLDWDLEIRNSMLYMHFQILILQGVITQLGQLLEIYFSWMQEQFYGVLVVIQHSTLHSYGWDNCASLGCCEGEVFRAILFDLQCRQVEPMCKDSTFV